MQPMINYETVINSQHYSLQDGEHAMRSSELEDSIRHREETIRHLEGEIRTLQSGVDDMSRELEMKGKEILRIRSEANTAAR